MDNNLQNNNLENNLQNTLQNNQENSINSETPIYENNSTETTQIQTSPMGGNIDNENIDPIYTISDTHEVTTPSAYVSNDTVAPTYTEATSPSTPYVASVPASPAPVRKKKFKTFMKFTAVFVVFVFLGGIVFGAGYGTALFLGDKITPELATRTQALTFDVNKIQPIVTGTVTEDGSKSLVSAIAKATGPSVVTVSSTIEVSQNSFFSNGTYETEGTGSGILYKLRDNDLLVVTNHHVIDGAKKVVVTFHEGQSFDASIVGYDSRMDLAILSIPLSDINAANIGDLTIATFGNSDELEVGELAVAIGNPLGKEFASTVTAGVISAVNREITIDGTQLNLLQTDAAINPGNSGGALVNSLGEVIGINTAKYADVSIEGMGFAIPSSRALPVLEKIIESSTGGDIAYSLDSDRPFLGVKISNITEDLYAQTGMPFGVYVTEVVKGSSADTAGIVAGDVIYSVDGTKVVDTDALFNVLAKKAVGDTIKISVARGDKVLTVEATLSKYGDVMEN